MFFITINYEREWCSNQGNIIALYLIDKENKLIDNDTINGCHYHNGEIEIKDWNNDKIDDIVFAINTPVQSVPIIGSYLRVYSLNKQTSKLYNKFELETQSRDCAFDQENVCELVERLYKFNDNRTMITIKENTFSFERADFEWEEQINNKKLVRDSSYYYYLDYKSLTYVKQD